ncbi:DMT family transporter [Agaribacter flavus]|uniref:DMT family transporter n=1 Tax=Agaribacter flavus TaxID=1902781 RepID=A0ABV7FVH2_9ALTE
MINYINQVSAVPLMLCSTVCQAIFVITVKQLLAQGLLPATILMVRSLVCILIFAPWMIRQKYLPPVSNLKIHIVRSTAFLVGGIALLTSLNNIPMTTVIAITYTSPVFVCIGAVVMFKEKISVHGIIALMISIIGVNMLFTGEMLINTVGLISAITATLMLTVAQISLKCLSQKETKTQIFVTQLCFTLPFFLTIFVLFGEPPTITHIPLLLLMSFSFTLGQIFLIMALSRGDLNRLMPLDSIRLILVALGGVYLFGDDINAQLICGSILVVAASIITLQGKHKSVSNNKPSS